MGMQELKKEVEAYLERLLGILEEDVTFEIEEDISDGLYVNLVGSMFSLPEERPILTGLEHLLRGALRRKTGQDVDVIPLPHPSGLSTWPRMEPGRTLLQEALQMIAEHPAMRDLMRE